MNTEETLTDLYELRNTGNDIARKYTLYRKIEESIKEKDKEIERLNYIIDEIEQYCLDEQMSEDYPDYNDFTEIFNSIYDTIYNKIQQLKRSDE